MVWLPQICIELTALPSKDLDWLSSKIILTGIGIECLSSIGDAFPYVYSLRYGEGEQMVYKGLTESQVRESRDKHGSNALTQKPPESLWHKFLEGFKDKMIIILLVALGVDVVFAVLGEASWVEVVGILAAIMIANLAGVISEGKNEAKFQELQAQASRIQVKVQRAEGATMVWIDDLVVDDAIILQAGDIVPIDGYIVSGAVKVNQAAMNGESDEVKKRAAIVGYEGKQNDLDDPHQVFRGTFVTSGEAVMVATLAGDATLYGKTALEMQEEAIDSPLKVKLNKLADQIAILGYTGSAAIALVTMFQYGFMDKSIVDATTFIQALLNSVMRAVTLIVMAVPEGLPMMIALVLGMNMARMLQDNVLVRKRNGIDTAGGVDLLFSDKTGTITTGELSVQTVYFGVETVGIEDRSFTEHQYNMLWNHVVGNSSAQRVKSDSGLQIVGGNQTEQALHKFLRNELGEVKVDAKVEFSSMNKFSAATVEGTTYIKGAAEIVLAHCSSVRCPGGVRPLTDMDRKVITDVMDGMAKKCMRVLAFATTAQTCESIRETELGNDLVFDFYVGIRDTVRPEAKHAIMACAQAGVQVVMITGDRHETAIAISKEAGLLPKEFKGNEGAPAGVTEIDSLIAAAKQGDRIALSHADLEAMTDEQIAEVLAQVVVISRALPTDKSRLVRIGQSLGRVVGMTGDGANDAAALNAADVGFGMGDGTDIAKSASDIVILDNNFQSIEKAILYGRTIFRSIRKFIIFQLTVNVAALLLSLLGPIMGVHEPLTIIQILWINLIMDTLAALAFGGEVPLKRYMLCKPVARSANILNKPMLVSICTSGVYIALMGLVIALSPVMQGFLGVSDLSHVYTALFSFFIYGIIFNSLNARAEGCNLFEHILDNRRFLVIMGAIAVMQLVMIYIGGEVLRTVPLDIAVLFKTMLLAVLVIPVNMLGKSVLAMTELRKEE